VEGGGIRLQNTLQRKSAKLALMKFSVHNLKRQPEARDNSREKISAIKLHLFILLNLKTNITACGAAVLHLTAVVLFGSNIPLSRQLCIGRLFTPHKVKKGSERYEEFALRNVKSAKYSPFPFPVFFFKFWKQFLHFFGTKYRMKRTF
jgi:hypothetical protein